MKLIFVDEFFYIYVFEGIFKYLIYKVQTINKGNLMNLYLNIEK